MASPQEQGQIYLERFREWIKSMSDDDFRQIVYSPKGILSLCQRQNSMMHPPRETLWNMVGWGSLRPRIRTSKYSSKNYSEKMCD